MRLLSSVQLATGRPATTLRRCARLLALVIGCYALWLLTTELTRPRLPYFPNNDSERQAIVAARDRAAEAASVGRVRGGLWTDYAMTVVFAPPPPGRSTETTDETSRTAIERAIALAPHDARAWLLLAQAAARADGINRNIAGPLKMSYYTGPNATALMPMRLSIATQGEVISDVELQILATNDLRTILLQRPDLRPAIIAAYRDASTSGRHFIETAVAQLDPHFVGELHAPSAPPQLPK